MSSPIFAPRLDDKLSPEALNRQLQQIQDTLNGRFGLIDKLGFLFTGIFAAGVPVNIKHAFGQVATGFIPIFKDNYSDFKVGVTNDTQSIDIISQNNCTAVILVVR